MNKFDTYVYLKMCWNTAWDYLSIPRDIIGKVLTLGTFLKVFGFSNYAILGVIGFIGIIGMFVFGHWTIKKGFMQRQTSIQNKYNPEIMKIVNNTDKNV